MKDNVLGERLTKIRKEKGVSIAQLSEKSGVPQGTIAKISAGITKNPGLDTLRAMVAALGVTLDDLRGELPYVRNVFPLEIRKIPLLGEIACGEPILAEEGAEAYALSGTDIGADFCLRARGDSMINARIFDGDIVFIRSQPDVDNGEIAAVLIGDEATLKRIYKYRARVELRPENPLFPVLEYENSELHKIKILGKAVAFQSAVR